MPKACDTVWLNMSGEGEHLWLVLCDPEPDGSVIFVNFTDHRNVPRPHVDIPLGTHLLVSGWATTIRTTLFTQGAMVLDAGIVDRFLADGRAPGELLPEWLPKMRKAMYKCSACGGDVMSILTRHLGKW